MELLIVFLQITLRENLFESHMGHDLYNHLLESDFSQHVIKPT